MNQQSAVNCSDDLLQDVQASMAVDGCTEVSEPSSQEAGADPSFGASPASSARVRANTARPAARPAARPPSSAPSSSAPSIASRRAKNPPARQSRLLRLKTEQIRQKHDLLYKINRLQQRGGRTSRRVSADDGVEDLTAEYERIKREVDVENSVKFQRSMMTSFTSGTEYLNTRFDPFGINLDGWSETISGNIGDYDEVFEQLHEKYQGGSTLPPEVRLVLMVASSAIMFHISRSVFQSMPGIEEVLRDDPGLAKQLASAVAKKAKSDADPKRPAGGIASMLTNLMMGGAPQPANGPSEPLRPPKEDADLEDLFADDADADADAGSTSSIEIQRYG